VVGAMFVPWIFYYLETNKLKKMAVCFLLLLFSKENMALWAFFISTGLLFTFKNEKQKAIYLAAISIT
jgi:uncharacterized membrane protein